MLPPLTPADALFLDFDGTLVEIAERPSLVVVTDELRSMLADVEHRLGGAVALISGRPVANLDELLAPARFAAAGEHGAEIRYSGDGPVQRGHTLPEDIAAAIAALSARLDGTEAELKRASASLHYRKAPEHEAAVVAGMRELESQLDGYALMLGKMVAELKPAAIDKGCAIHDLCQHAPFAGRRPVFVGDDVTDEAGFDIVNQLGGVSVRVGPEAPTRARHRLPAVADVHAWLERLIDQRR